MSLEPHAVAAMAVTAAALILFTRERVPLEYSCLAVLLILVLVFELFPYERAETPAVPPPAATEISRKMPASPLEVSPGADLELVPGTASDLSLRGSAFLLGFGNQALITICLLLIVVKGVEVSGALRPLGRRARLVTNP